VKKAHDDEHDEGVAPEWQIVLERRQATYNDRALAWQVPSPGPGPRGIRQVARRCRDDRPFMAVGGVPGSVACRTITSE